MQPSRPLRPSRRPRLLVLFRQAEGRHLLQAKRPALQPTECFFSSLKSRAFANSILKRKNQRHFPR